MRSIKTTIKGITVALALVLAGCSGELTDDASPVELVVTNTQNLQVGSPGTELEFAL